MKEIFLTGGSDPVSASLSISLGVLWGIFPVIGTSTLLCTLSSVILRLNMVIIQGVNYAIYPVQIALLLPFYHMGHQFTGFDVNTASLSVIEKASFSMETLGGLSGELLLMVTNMLVGWLSLAPLLSVAVYFVANFALTYRMQKIEKKKAIQPKQAIDPLSND